MLAANTNRLASRQCAAGLRPAGKILSDFGFASPQGCITLASLEFKTHEFTASCLVCSVFALHTLASTGQATAPLSTQRSSAPVAYPFAR
jgi:hypothetical protein